MVEPVLMAPADLRPAAGSFRLHCVCEEAVVEVRHRCPACPSQLRSSSVGQSPFWAREEAGPVGLRCRRSSPLHAPTACWPAGKKKSKRIITRAATNHYFCFRLLYRLFFWISHDYLLDFHHLFWTAHMRYTVVKAVIWQVSCNVYHA